MTQPQPLRHPLQVKLLPHTTSPLLGNTRTPLLGLDVLKPVQRPQRGRLVAQDVMLEPPR